MHVDFDMAVFAQCTAGIGGMEDDIVECVKRGSGVPYERYPRFHEAMEEDSGQSVLSTLESHILPLVPSLTDRLARGTRARDAGCGRGRIMTRLAELYLKCNVTTQPRRDHIVARVAVFCASS